MSTVASEAVLVDKGLKRDSVGLLASVVLALSSVAPAYALTATLGPTVGEVGAQMPATFLVGFVPMLLVAYAYGLTAFAAAWYFRHEARRDLKSLLLKGIAPLLGGLTLAAVFVQLVIDTTDPAYGSGGSIFGLGTVFVLGVGVLALGVVIMFVWQARAPEFFRGEVLKKDTPALVVEE